MTPRIETPARHAPNWRLLALVTFAGIVLFVGFFALRGLASAPSAAAATNLDNETLRIAKNLYCPVCPSTPLDVCDTQACVQWRALIREKLAAGQNEQQIRAYFVEQYGERVLGAPPAEGFNLGAYVLPLLALAAGLAILFGAMRGWQRSRQAAPSAAPPSPIAPEYAERIARALEEGE